MIVHRLGVYPTGVFVAFDMRGDVEYLEGRNIEVGNATAHRTMQHSMHLLNYMFVVARRKDKT